VKDKGTHFKQELRGVRGKGTYFKQAPQGVRGKRTHFTQAPRKRQNSTTSTLLSLGNAKCRRLLRNTDTIFAWIHVQVPFDLEM